MAGTTGNDVTLVHSGVTVTISTSGDEENFTKSLINIGQPKTTNGQDITEGENPLKIIDLLMKAERRITIDGFLVNGVNPCTAHVTNGGSATDTSTTAAGKKADLKSIFFAGCVFSMTYEGATFNVNSDKLSIKRITNDGQAAAVGEAEFSVKMTMIRGEN